MRCLNIGAGEKIKKSTEKEEWINLDIRKLEGIDIVCDLAKQKIPLEDNSIDFILAEDILEHFSPNELRYVLRELIRVLKKGKEMQIKTPDIFKIFKAFEGGAINSFELDRKIFGNRDYEGNYHKIGFTKESIQFYLNEAGFQIIQIHDMNLYDWSNMQVICRKI